MRYTLLVLLVLSFLFAHSQKKRARQWGIPFEGITGPLNAITDVKGVEVGYSTIIRGDGINVLGKGPVVAETYDGFLNDIYGFHVTEEHASKR